MAIETVTLAAKSVEIVLADAAASDDGDNRIVLPWAPESTRRKREIIQPAGSNEPRLDRAMRPRARSVFVSAFSDAHRWLDELIADPSISITSLAAREHKSERSIRLILSLAFLAPDLAKAATEGNLPRGFKRARLVDLPMLWSDQWKAIGLQRPSSEA